GYWNKRNPNDRNDGSCNNWWKEAHKAAEKPTDQHNKHSRNKNSPVNSGNAILATDRNHWSNCSKRTAQHNGKSDTEEPVADNLQNCRHSTKKNINCDQVC